MSLKALKSILNNVFRLRLQRLGDFLYPQSAVILREELNDPLSWRAFTDSRERAEEGLALCPERRIRREEEPFSILRKALLRI